MNTRVLIGSVCMAWMALELAVRMSGAAQTYPELRSGFYQSSYVMDQDNPLRVNNPFEKLIITAPEYSFPRQVNTHGFSDLEFGVKQPGQLLIQTYGDSFTEGDGAPYDSAYPTILRHILQQNFSKDILIQNFGIRGNDPGFYWKQLRDIGEAMRPDIVVISYGSYDYTTDFFTRGGLSRFHDGLWSALPAPWWEFIYANSHLVRIILDIAFDVEAHAFLTTPAQREERLRALRPAWNEVFDSIADLARRAEARVLLIKKPERSEIDAGEYEEDLSFFDHYLEKDTFFRHFDLNDYYRSERKLTADSTYRYYWKHDGHHNSKGYELMAQGVHQALIRSFPERFALPDSTSREVVPQ
ncbi:MAG: SGNH/GDSL hydrolase family protein [Flavobacteriales bacterium]|nr:SGNH/GDSL hydrolase family protein [Flavobacteriales bacterium]